MLMPKKQKYRKQMRGRLKGLAQRGSTLSFGEFGLKAMERSHLTSAQIESARKTISGATKRAGRVWFRVFPDKPMTKKPLAVRMGSGKGAVDHYAVKIRPGKIIFEISGLDEATAREAMRKASHKLPFKTKFVKE
ncbi:50S ribosomal protein L16 [Patescibacteria group bacterium]|nr:50S ribosomal protein L16 [Patescibacteria group bacterium]